MKSRQPIASLAALLVVVSFGASVWLQVVRDRRGRNARIDTAVLYVSSGRVLQRLALSFESLLADVYWIRALQSYGSTKLSTDAGKRYDLLYPFLDITTTLDPRFNIAYRFGAIFLAEAYPNGPGRPDLAIRLLEKGVTSMPEKWQYLQDIGFVHYWWLHDYEGAARWFRRASRVAGAPAWLEPMAAATLEQGGRRTASRRLWHEILETAENAWLRREASRRLGQLDAFDTIDRLRTAVGDFKARQGRWPDTWLQVVQAGLLPAVPLDPTGTPYRLTPHSGEVDVSPRSPLYPLPTEPPRLPRAGL